MQKLIVANWKMNLNPGEASLLVSRLADHVETPPDTQVVLCPPFIDLYPMAKDIDNKRFKLGAQNVYHLDEGAYTGEVSAAMLKGLVQYAIVGHSERRAMGERDKQIALKVAAALRNGIVPVLCVGDTVSDRAHGLSTKVVIDQLTADLAQLTSADVAHLVVAYEPVWAIGTGKFATPDQVRPVVSAIRQTVEELYGEEGAAGLRVLYGGSVDADNAGTYLKLPGIQGLLVGGASLNYAEFAKIVAAAR